MQDNGVKIKSKGKGASCADSYDKIGCSIKQD